ncbi:MAG: PAS domain S-box protein [Clostridia bacterium]|jgi:two-component system CheB/CheR fusion protein|nr:PAS domain S-box protein [Clostridia bacterium]
MKKISAVITFIDITEQKRMQNSIKRLAVIVRDSQDAITMLDLQGKILAWNPGAKKIYGWSEAEALTMNIQELVPKSRNNEALEMLNKLSRLEKIEPFQTQRLSKNGKIVDVGVTVSLLVNEAGEPYAIAAMERCIS